MIHFRPFAYMKRMQNVRKISSMNQHITTLIKVKQGSEPDKLPLLYPANTAM